jgi:hypothetical protein
MTHLVVSAGTMIGFSRVLFTVSVTAETNGQPRSGLAPQHFIVHFGSGDIDVDPVRWPVQELNEAPNGIYTVLMDANHPHPVIPGGIYVFTISVHEPTTGDRGTVVIPFQFPVN